MQIHTLEYWGTLSYERRHAYLADATPEQRYEQACVIARAARRAVGEIFNAWVAMRLIEIADAADALASAAHAVGE